MHTKRVFTGMFLVIGFASGGLWSRGETPALVTLESLQKAAQAQGVALEVPRVESTVEELKSTYKSTIEQTEKNLDAIAGQDLHKVTYKSSVEALEYALYPVNEMSNRFLVISETHRLSEVRTSAHEILEQIAKWGVDIFYRDDLYGVVKALKKKKPALAGEQQRLFSNYLRDYRRAGLELPNEKREKAKLLKKKIAELENRFRQNVTESKQVVQFSLEDLNGLSEDYLAKIRNPNKLDVYAVNAHVFWEYYNVMEHAEKESTRKKIFIARTTMAFPANKEVLKDLVLSRRELAKVLGYKTWAHYKMETKMAKNPETVLAFLTQISQGLEKTFRKKREEYRKMKVADTKDKNAVLKVWDGYYYSNKVQREKFNVDNDKVKVFFPMQQVLQGMFSVYSKIFGLTFVEIEPPYKWTPDLKFYVAIDSKSNKPLGGFYLDLYPRDGKYNHFAMFDLVKGYKRADGQYIAPMVALLCNFPPAQGDTPSLLLHKDVETLFHEFGHALHSIVTRAVYPSMSGASVPLDFLEAPSQMLENWVWDRDVLDSFAADYRDPKKKIPPELFEKMLLAKKEDNSRGYRFQVNLANIDLSLHTIPDHIKNINPQAISQKMFEKYYLPVPPETAYEASWDHLVEYDAAYYGYLWSLAISEDLASVFEASPKKFLDPQVGMKLRREIFEPGDSREVSISIEKFLGRKRSLKAFFKELGIAQ